MAEPDAAGPGPSNGPARPPTLADIRRDMERSTAPLRAAMEQMERSTAPLRAAAAEAERHRRQIAAVFENGIGRQLRQIVGFVEGPNPPPDAAPRRPTFGPNGPAEPWPISPTIPAPARPPATEKPPGSADSRVALDASPEAMATLVERVAEEVVRRLAAPPTPKPGARAEPVKGRRGRRRREISVGGVDAALEALAEEDPSVRALAARALEERVPYAYTTIQKCDTYKAWRRDLKRLRMEAAADGMADVLDAGLARIRKKKPGRERLADPTIDPAVEKMTKEFLRFHGEEGLDGQ